MLSMGRHSSTHTVSEPYAMDVCIAPILQIRRLGAVISHHTGKQQSAESMMLKNIWDSFGGLVVKTLPANLPAGDMGLIPGPGRSHTPQSN